MTYTFKLARRLASMHQAVWRRLPVFLVSLLVGGCTAGGAPTVPDTPPPPPVTAVSGWLTIQLTTPNSTDGAVQLAVSGPGVDSVRAVAPYTGYGVVSSAAGHVVVTGSIGNGAVARVWVRDVSKSGQVVASVSAAAARGTYALSDLSGYRATVVR